MTLPHFDPDGLRRRVGYLRLALAGIGVQPVDGDAFAARLWAT